MLNLADMKVFLIFCWIKHTNIAQLPAYKFQYEMSINVLMGVIQFHPSVVLVAVSSDNISDICMVSIFSQQSEMWKIENQLPAELGQKL